MVPGLQEEGRAGRCVLADTFSLSLCRRRAKTTLAWRGMRSPPCWRTPCHRRSESSRRKSAAKQKLNGEQAPAKLAALQHSLSGGRAASPSVAGARAVVIQ